MNVWLVTIGEPVPSLGTTGDRLHRAGLLARSLGARGHDVTWWTSTFDHFHKAHWFPQDTTVELNGRLRMRFLHGCGYKRNISIARLIDHHMVAGKFRRVARRCARPDIIVAALPTIELCYESVEYGLVHKVPVVLDMRDMWPDILVDVLPRAARPIARALAAPLFRKARLACAGATAITGITEGFVEWGLRRGRRGRSVLDRAFPMGYPSEPPSSAAVREAEAFWDQLGVRSEGGEAIICYIGAISHHFDGETIIRAAQRLEAVRARVRFVLCGTGDRLEHWRRAAAGLGNVTFPGWINAPKIYVLLRRSTMGLDPLPNRYDFLATINNKAIEYLSAGLPVISSPCRGVLYELLRDEGCGAGYESGDVERLTELLRRLPANHQALEAMRRRARRVFQSRFAAEMVYAQMGEYLEEIVAEVKGATRSKSGITTA